MNADFERARQLFLLGVEHHEAGRFEAAEAALSDSLHLLPGRASTLMNRGATRLALGRPQDALRDLQASLAAEPDNSQTWCHVGTALTALERHPEALEAWDRALSLAPGLPAARFHRAMTLARLQRHAQALDALQPLLDAADPSSAPAWLLAGQALQNLDRHEEALQPYQTALRLAPRLPRAAVLLGQLLHSLGRTAEAQATHAGALAYGIDADLNGYLLAGLRGEAAPPASPAAYVRGLFDPYAEDFEQHLLASLHYRGHRAVVDAAARAAPGRTWHSVLDLGCGTGLCGPLIRAQAHQLTGVDLSPTMVATAQRKGAYDEVLQADIADHLAHTAQRHDLLLAADVFIYVGALEAVFAGAQRVMLSGGFFAFSVETAAEGQDLTLLPSLRYAHGEAYLRRLAATHQMAVKHIVHAPLRHEQGRPIAGMYVYLQRR